jgi:hypothetical protein
VAVQGRINDREARLVTNAARLARPGEEVQFVFPARTTNPGVLRAMRLVSSLIVLIMAFYTRHRFIVITSERILVCKAKRFKREVVGEVLRVVPRVTQIGTTENSWIKTTSFGGRLYIYHRYIDFIVKADVRGWKPVTRDPS